MIIDAIERTDADAPLLLSPFFSQYGANSGIESAKLFWASFIKSVNFREHDIFCPQDAVGAGWTIEENLVAERTYAFGRMSKTSQALLQRAVRPA